MSEREAFERILASLHEAALDRAHWSTASALIDDILRAHGSSMVSLLLIPSSAETRYFGRPSDWLRWLRRRGAMTSSCRVARPRKPERML